VAGRCRQEQVDDAIARLTSPVATDHVACGSTRREATAQGRMPGRPREATT
jgi:hypothetical protein